MTLRVERYEGDASEWDGFLRGQEGWTHFHQYGWKRVIESVHGHECIYLAARDDGGRLDAVLPMVRVQSPVFGRFLVSMPFVNYGGPVGSRGGVRALVDRAAEIAARDGLDLLELRARGQLETDLSASHHKITVLKDLAPGDPSTVWDGFDSKLRNKVRKPSKEGVEVVFGRDQMDGFWDVFSLHMRNLGTPVQPRELFESIADEFGDSVWIGCARLDGKAIAGGFALRWGNELEMSWSSDLIEYRSLRANMLLYWKFMERACEEGLSIFNFGRSTPDSGTHRFKQQWGTRDQQLWWYQRASEGTDRTPSPDDDTWSWGPKIWQKVPLPVANRVGPAVVKYIP